MKFKTVIFILLLAGSSSLLFAQDEANPLSPGDKNFVEINSGLIVSAGQNIASGEYNVDCEDCHFSGGVGSGSLLGLYVQQGINDNWHYGLIGSVDWWSLKSVFTRNDADNVYIAETNEFLEVFNLKKRHESNASFTMLSLAPYLKYRIADVFYIRLSLPISFPIDTHLDHNVELETKTHLINGKIFEIEQVTKNPIQDSDFPQMNSVVYSLATSIGFKIKVGDYFTLNPAFQYRFGLTNLSENGKDFRVNSWRLMFEFNIPIAKSLRDREKK